MRSFLTSTLSWFLLLATTGSGNAAAIFTNFGADGSCAITFYGDIVQGDDLRFDGLTPDCNGGGVLLKSRGGLIGPGLRIGELIRQKGLETAVSFDAACASACALAWLGGVKRQMFVTSRIGFHAAYSIDASGSPVESGLGNALVGAYMTTLGLPTNAVIFATMAKPESMSWLDPQGAADLGIEVFLLTAQDMAWISQLDQNGQDFEADHNGAPQ